MGVRDYTCSVCGTAGAYECRENTRSGGECQQVSIGDSDASLDFFFFEEDAAPAGPSELEAHVARAKRVVTEKREYAWDEWEFVPSLNYRTLLMDDEDAVGIWRLAPFREHDDGSPIEGVEIAEGEVVWVVNYCTLCREHAMPTGTRDADLCKVYLEKIAEHLGVPDPADKVTFMANVRARVAARRPPPPKEGPRVIRRKKSG